MKKYKLLKDLPRTKAGLICNADYFCAKGYPISWLNDPDWFEVVKEEKRIPNLELTQIGYKNSDEEDKIYLDINTQKLYSVADVERIYETELIAERIKRKHKEFFEDFVKKTQAATMPNLYIGQLVCSGSHWRELKDYSCPRRGELFLVKFEDLPEEKKYYAHLLIAENSTDFWCYNNEHHNDYKKGIFGGTKLSFHGITHWKLIGEIN